MPGEAHRRRIRALLRRAGVSDAGDMSAVEQAFVHESASKERGQPSNERMEFLGDSVLGLIAARWLYERFADEPEGKLTVRKAAIVNDAQLAATARRLRFGELMQLGTGMRNAGGADNTSILADAFEAFVAAVYLRYGIEAANRFVCVEHVGRLDHGAQTVLDAKTRLQHYAQQYLGGTPAYVDTADGTPQEPSFRSDVFVGDNRLGAGSGASKRAAQQAAAEAALVHVSAAAVPAPDGDSAAPAPKRRPGPEGRNTAKAPQRRNPTT